MFDGKVSVDHRLKLVYSLLEEVVEASHAECLEGVFAPRALGEVVPAVEYVQFEVLLVGLGAVLVDVQGGVLFDGDDVVGDVLEDGEVRRRDVNGEVFALQLLDDPELLGAVLDLGGQGLRARLVGGGHHGQAGLAETAQAVVARAGGFLGAAGFLARGAGSEPALPRLGLAVERVEQRLHGRVLEPAEVDLGGVAAAAAAAPGDRVADLLVHLVAALVVDHAHPVELERLDYVQVLAAAREPHPCFVLFSLHNILALSTLNGFRQFSFVLLCHVLIYMKLLLFIFNQVDK